MITPRYSYTVSDAGQCEIRDSTAFTGPGSEDGDLVLTLHGGWNTEEFAHQVCNALTVYELFMALNERKA